MKKINNILALLVIALMGLSLTACSSDNLDTNQFQGDVSLNAFGPNPVMRGGQLRFVGSNLDQVASINIPGIGEVTNFEVIKSGVPSELRVAIPKDGPTVGKVVLKTKSDQKIETQNELTYIEGIEVTGFTPTEADPGTVIKIEGDYLNLIYSIAFADGVLVSSSEFKSWDRYFIEVAVPEEAQTGKIELYTADLTIQRTKKEEDELEYQTFITEEALIVGTPTTTKLESPRGVAGEDGVVTAKAGETISLTGKFFNIVTGIKFGDVLQEEFIVSEDGTTLSFVVPAEAASGAINLVLKSGIEAIAGTLATILPSECVAAPTPVKAGNALTITGKDLDIVTSVMFANAEGNYTVAGGDIIAEAAKVVINSVPNTAIEGNVRLITASGEYAEVPFTLVKPIVTGYDNFTVSAGGALTIQGTDLDLVVSVQFGDESDVVEVENATAEAISLQVPMNAASGAPILTLANGTKVENVPALTIEEAVFCYATELPGEDAEIKAGESLTLPVANGDKLTGVQIDGNDCQYVLVKNNTELIIGVPDKAKKGSKVRLISSNGEITYTIDFIPNTEVTTVLWTGALDLNAWSINWQIGDGTAGASNPKMFVDMDIQEGDVIRLYATAYNDWWQIQFFNGHWEAQNEIGTASGLNNNNNINSDIYNLAEHDGAIEITATAELVRQLTEYSDWGYCWILQGEGLVITKIAVTHYVSLETTLWKGDLDFNGWGINWQIGDGTAGADNPKMFVEAGLKAGMTVRLYVDAYNDWWQVQFYNGHWEAQNEIGTATGLNNNHNVNSGIYNLAEHNGAIEIPVTEELARQLTEYSDWGYCWILQGEGCRATKITIE
jgi:hypothetical protein